MELSNTNIKKSFYIFSKESFCYISGNGNFSYLKEVTFRAQKLEKEKHS